MIFNEPLMNKREAQGKRQSRYDRLEEHEVDNWSATRLPYSNEKINDRKENNEDR